MTANEITIEITITRGTVAIDRDENGREVVRVTGLVTGDARVVFGDARVVGGDSLTLGRVKFFMLGKNGGLSLEN